MGPCLARAFSRQLYVQHVMQGYMVGTVLYFAIVYSLPISMGLAAVALDLPVSHCPCYHAESFARALCSDVMRILSVDGGSKNCAHQGKIHLIHTSNAVHVKVSSSLAMLLCGPGVTWSRHGKWTG